MLGEAVPPALAAAIYPPALLFMAFVLVRPQPRKRAVIVLAGAVVITLGVGFAVVLLLQNTGWRAVSIGQSPRGSTSASVRC
ncbi:hypothetical protein ACQP04_02860 [Pseudonocardia halophobica]|uniref:hypothetical protein n=1 Tax=Pseudonocardia halophobica TaxID=29401 RepID=UPI003D91044F